jgi:MerR family transcriptional regulator, thiopeptide resistance regulator
VVRNGAGGGPQADGWSVGQVAELTGVTVRTLHHCDDIGLLSPRGRTRAGYRMYDGGDVDRLMRIMAYRELGLSLDDIAAVLDDPGRDRVTVLRQQHALLVRRLARLQRMVEAVEKELEAEKMGISLTPEERAELFGDWSPEEHEQEADDRWGTTTAYAESRRRVSSYTKDDWQRIKDEAAQLESSMADALRKGVGPASEQGMALAERHREQISRWYYDCGYPMHRGLGQMYVDDDRFRARYEDIEPGLAAWLCAAITANADAREA